MYVYEYTSVSNYLSSINEIECGKRIFLGAKTVLHQSNNENQEIQEWASFQLGNVQLEKLKHNFWTLGKYI